MYIIIFFLNLLILIYSKSNSYISIPFYIKNKQKEKLLMEYLFEYKMYINLNIGSPSILIPIYISLTDFTSYIIDYSYNNNSLKYNHLLSNTYYNTSEISKFFGLDYNKGKKSHDIININNFKIENYTFILVTNLTHFDDDIYGVLGLRINNNVVGLVNGTNFIDQIHERKIFNQTEFCFKFKNDKEGFLEIGDITKNNKDEYYFMKAEFFGGEFQWVMKFDQIFYDDSNNNLVNENAIINNNYGYIESSEGYKKEIIKNFFQKYLNNNLCFQEYLKNQNYSFFIYCKKEIDIKKFKPIKFFIKENYINLTLDYKDLFIENNNYYHFLIIFSIRYRTFWYLGSPFLKKFNLIFDSQNKIMKLKIFKKSNYIISLPWILVFILLILLIFLIIVLIKFIHYFPKKKRFANELDDSYEYNPNYVSDYKKIDNNKIDKLLELT